MKLMSYLLAAYVQYSRNSSSISKISPVQSLHCIVVKRTSSLRTTVDEQIDLCPLALAQRLSQEGARHALVQHFNFNTMQINMNGNSCTAGVICYQVMFHILGVVFLTLMIASILCFMSSIYNTKRFKLLCYATISSLSNYLFD